MKAIAFAVAASMIAAPVVAQPSAKAFVEGLYEAYRNPDAPSTTGAAAVQVYSPALVTLIRADQKAAGGEAGKLNSDPLCGCQDADGLTPLSIKIVPVSPRSAMATSIFRLGGHVRTVGLRLVRTPHGWRVDDVSSHDLRSLRRFLVD